MAFLGFGTLFKHGTSTIGEVVTINPPALSKDTPEATHLTSTGRWKEFISGLRDGGECSIEVNYLPANTTQELLETAFEADVTATYSITYSDSATTVHSFSAICNGLQPGAVTAGDVVKANMSFKLTGAPTLD